MERTILLVDDEANILSALTRVLRPCGYRILRAESGAEGLALLANNEVGVIVSDQRMPQMTGVSFLQKVRELYPDTVRIVLSGYTELNSITDAINRGSIYKFLTKPWDDELLRENIEEAFQRYEMKRENARLAMELSMANEALKQRVKDKTREEIRDLRMLELSQDMLESLPVGVVGIGSDGMIAFTNRCAREQLGENRALLGETANDVLGIDILKQQAPASHPSLIATSGQQLQCWCDVIGAFPDIRGWVLVLAPKQA